MSEPPITLRILDFQLGDQQLWYASIGDNEYGYSFDPRSSSWTLEKVQDLDPYDDLIAGGEWKPIKHDQRHLRAVFVSRAWTLYSTAHNANGSWPALAEHCRTAAMYTPDDESALSHGNQNGIRWFLAGASELADLADQQDPQQVGQRKLMAMSFALGQRLS